MTPSEEEPSEALAGSSSEEIRWQLHALADSVNAISLRVELLWRAYKAKEETMSEPEHIEPLREEAIAHVPGASTADLLKWWPVVMKLLAFVKSGQGVMSTWTPLGKRWIIITDKDPSAS
jgi:hypothetical protein